MVEKSDAEKRKDKLIRELLDIPDIEVIEFIPFPEPDEEGKEL